MPPEFRGKTSPVVETGDQNRPEKTTAEAVEDLKRAFRDLAKEVRNTAIVRTIARINKELSGLIQKRRGNHAP